METSELLRNIINLPIFSSGLAEEMLSGNFRSIFKGQGMEFDEARHYQAGDDIRSIDWNASARFGYPFVKMYREERELTILLLIDISASMHCSGRLYTETSEQKKSLLNSYEQALICASLIAFSAEHTGQQVGAFFFDKEIEKVFPPRKGRKHIMPLIMAALQYQNNNQHKQSTQTTKVKYGSNINCALTGAQQLLKKRSLVILISDFFSINWEHEMGILCRKHDCTAIRICGPKNVPYPGLVTIEDPETGIRIEAPAGLDSFQESWEAWHNERTIFLESQCKKNGASFLDISTETDAPAALMKFFGSRNSSAFKNRKKI
ncbi:MAG: DUF58 domain-containing protein [Treponema sp.]|nr:DUF58 domain-containing protein [Treponema sp.]MCL2251099.1 DUF58 domain-containing protein [Treponema sp.]